MRTRSAALGAAGILLLTACGVSSTNAGPAGSQPPIISGAVDATTVPSGSATTTTDIADIDVCSMLSQADAAEVARQLGLNGAQTAKTVYTLTKKRVDVGGDEPSVTCKFSIDGQGAEGTVEVQVTSAKDFELYAGTDHKVSGLGDEAYSDGDDTVVRVGGLMLSTGEDSFDNDFVVALYRKIIPHLR